MNQSPLSIAQVTDIHLFADEKQELLGINTTKSFQAVVERLISLQNKIDALLVTGDLSQDGTPTSYQRLQHLLVPLNKPTYWIPGNHDDFAVMQQILNQAFILPQKEFTWGGWNFVLINSAVPGNVRGHLSETTLAWLERQLVARKTQPTLIALHHPPFAVNSLWLDRSILENADEFFAILDRHPQVKLVLFGHIHQEFHCQRNGVHYLGSPATSVQFEPHSTQFALRPEYPGFRLIQLYPNGRWLTQIERVACSEYILDLAATGY
ncbi:3',5'-cyclic-AMP phosphodiesterase [Chroococcidiopsis sp. TS-821]|uniref:3',5'-cyclic-AMP phosphodiesterase n=1 Tax=Chroococcidiopsis sp. TS-821 TaxID=1378066 RepID=UPI000CEF4911|nr:3',5'-cyclic-AMP phosphodiesterase [Chroococcidiopsis sp. TS-821]PPS46057.1 3',5'-cyclic-AMP phosphodiesterase [Chroococcidiopsis sp. TS-821]